MTLTSFLLFLVVTSEAMGVESKVGENEQLEIFAFPESAWLLNYGKTVSVTNE